MPKSMYVIALASAISLAPRMADAATLPFETKELKLKNGLRLVMVPYDSPGLLAYYSLVRVGSRDEVEKGVTGFAHFFEHMMFRGTEMHPPDKVQDLLKKAGADQNGFTTDDFTCYTFVGSNGFLEELVTYEADRFQNLKYSEADFKTEAGAVLGEYNKSTSGTYLPIQEKLRAAIFASHTYGHTTLGYRADIEDMPNQYAYSLEFFERFYTPDNVILFVVGDFDPAKLEALVRTHYSGWNRKRVNTKTRPDKAQKKEVRESVDFPSSTLPMLSMSWRTPATKFASADTAVYNVVFELLYGKTSPLYETLVLKEQKVASFSEWSWNHRDPYVFQVVATVNDKTNLPAVEVAMDGAATALVTGKLDAASLDAVKSNVKYGLLLGLSTPSDVAQTLVWFTGPTGEVGGLELLLGAIERVTVNDVKRFAKNYLTKKNRAVVTLATKEASK